MAAGRGLKVALGAAAFAAVVGGALWSLSHRGPVLAPDFAAPDLRGQAVSLSSLRGKVVVLNVWATWCPPCRQEMPSMERLAAHFRGRDFQLLAVSQDEGGKERSRRSPASSGSRSRSCSIPSARLASASGCGAIPRRSSSTAAATSWSG
jgi:hypothetical protein